MIDAAECCRLDRRRRAIVDAARALFAEQGFDNTTLGAIVARSGGSLATIYKLFGNKEGLLEAVIFESPNSGEAIIVSAEAAGGSPADILYRIGAGLQCHLLDAESISLVRIVVARSMADRDFAELFFERTVSRTRAALQRLFARWRERGIAMNRSPEFLAELFLDLFVSDMHVEAIGHGIGAERSPARLRARTDFFLCGAGLSDERTSASREFCESQ